MSPRLTVCHQTRRRWKSWLKWQNREGYQFFIFYSWKFVTPNKILIKFLSYMFILYLTAGWSLCKDILWRPHEEAVRVNWPGSPWLPGYRKQRSEHAQEVNTHIQFSGLKTETMWPWLFLGGRALMGSVSTYVVNHAACPVTVVKENM
jgi:hypothetical protein